MLLSPDRLQEVSWNVTSQFGEDGIIAHCLETVGTFHDAPWCVEVGANDGEWFSNTKVLRDAGWSAVLVEKDESHAAKCRGSFESERVRVVEARVEPIGENSIDAILVREGAPRHPDFISIDVDGIEYELLSQMIARPRVLCVEFAYQKDSGGVDGSGQWSKRDMTLLCEKMGYCPAAATEVNLILVRSDLSSRFG